jgi:hypothetical protein
VIAVISYQEAEVRSKCSVCGARFPAIRDQEAVDELSMLGPLCSAINSYQLPVIRDQESGNGRSFANDVMIAQRLGFVSGASTAPVLRETDEPAKMMFRMRERVMKNLDGSEPGQRALRSNQRR